MELGLSVIKNAIFETQFYWNQILLLAIFYLGSFHDLQYMCHPFIAEKTWLPTEEENIRFIRKEVRHTHTHTHTTTTTFNPILTRLRNEKWVPTFVVLDENKLLFYRDHKSKEAVSCCNTIQSDDSDWLTFDLCSLVPNPVAPSRCCRPISPFWWIRRIRKPRMSYRSHPPFLSL